MGLRVWDHVRGDICNDVGIWCGCADQEKTDGEKHGGFYVIFTFQTQDLDGLIKAHSILESRVNF